MTDHRLIRIIANIAFASSFLFAPAIGWAEGGGYDKESMFHNFQKQDANVGRFNTENSEVEETQIVLPLPPKRPQNLDAAKAAVVPSSAASAPERALSAAVATTPPAQKGVLSQEDENKSVAAPMPPARPSFATDTAQSAPVNNHPSSPINASAQLASAPIPGVSFSRVSLSTPSAVLPANQAKDSEPVVPIFTSVPLPPQRPQLADVEEERQAPVQAAAIPPKPRSADFQKYSVLDSGDRPVNFFQQSFEKVPEPQDSAAAEAPANPRILSKLNRVVGDDPRRAGQLRSLIHKHASENGIPFKLADAVVRIESRYNSDARNGPYMGLMQIHPSTARSLGYSGDSSGLLDPDTNLRYGIKYLAMAYRLANGDTCGTVMRYQGGHRAVTMTSSAQKYCSKIKMIFAENLY